MFRSLYFTTHPRSLPVRRLHHFAERPPCQCEKHHYISRAVSTFTNTLPKCTGSKPVLFMCKHLPNGRYAHGWLIAKLFFLLNKPKNIPPEKIGYPPATARAGTASSNSRFYL